MLRSRGKQLAQATISKSKKSYASELKMYAEYCKTFNIDPYSINLDQLINFLSLFASGFSAEKYLQAVKWAFNYARQDDSVLFHKSVKQVISGSQKETEQKGLKKKFIYVNFEENRQTILKELNFQVRVNLVISTYKI